MSNEEPANKNLSHKIKHQVEVLIVMHQKMSTHRIVKESYEYFMMTKSL